MLRGHVPRIIDARKGKNYKAQTARTKHRVRVDQHPPSILPIWYEIEDQAEAHDIPRLSMLVEVHEQKILFENGWMARMQVDGRHIQPRRTATIIVRPDRADLE